jgi:hypothetical protein
VRHHTFARLALALAAVRAALDRTFDQASRV